MLDPDDIEAAKDRARKIAASRLDPDRFSHQEQGRFQEACDLATLAGVAKGSIDAAVSKRIDLLVELAFKSDDGVQVEQVCEVMTGMAVARSTIWKARQRSKELRNRKAEAMVDDAETELSAWLAS